jgi:hypothetical protein
VKPTIHPKEYPMSKQMQVESPLSRRQAKTKPIRNRIQEMVAKAHNPALADRDPGLVFLIFDDGELSLTKCGPLLWQRSVHLVEHGLGVSFGIFPVSYGEHTCAFVTEEDGKKIREQMRKEYPKITGRKTPSEQALHLKYMRNLMIKLSNGSREHQDVIAGFEAELEKEQLKAG